MVGVRVGILCVGRHTLPACSPVCPMVVENNAEHCLYLFLSGSRSDCFPSLSWQNVLLRSRRVPREPLWPWVSLLAINGRSFSGLYQVILFSRFFMLQEIGFPFSSSIQADSSAFLLGSCLLWHTAQVWTLWRRPPDLPHTV